MVTDESHDNCGVAAGIAALMADAAFALADDPSAARQDAIARHPVARFGEPADIARAVAWLAGSDAAFVTGQTFVVDGGLTAASPLNPALF